MLLVVGNRYAASLQKRQQRLGFAFGFPFGFALGLAFGFPLGFALGFALVVGPTVRFAKELLDLRCTTLCRRPESGSSPSRHE